MGTWSSAKHFSVMVSVCALAACGGGNADDAPPAGSNETVAELPRLVVGDRIDVAVYAGLADGRTQVTSVGLSTVQEPAPPPITYVDSVWTRSAKQGSAWVYQRLDQEGDYAINQAFVIDDPIVSLADSRCVDIRRRSETSLEWVDAQGYWQTRSQGYWGVANQTPILALSADAGVGQAYVALDAHRDEWDAQIQDWRTYTTTVTNVIEGEEVVVDPGDGASRRALKVVSHVHQTFRTGAGGASGVSDEERTRWYVAGKGEVLLIVNAHPEIEERHQRMGTRAVQAYQESGRGLCAGISP